MGFWTRPFKLPESGNRVARIGVIVIICGLVTLSCRSTSSEAFHGGLVSASSDISEPVVFADDVTKTAGAAMEAGESEKDMGESSLQGEFDEKSNDGQFMMVTDEEEKYLSGLNEAEEGKLSESSESHQYQAEVNRLMDIIINSLYTQKEVFLRELMSNAADALEKVRFLSVQKSDILESKKYLDIRVDYDKDQKTISIQDSGIGMTKQDLINNLGTVAKSGTTNFLEAIAAGGDVNLIGQFGVGFYSAFLIADKVTVYSKSNDDKQQIWISKADGSYSIAEDPRGNTLGRGTRITLHLKEDATEFLSDSKLKDLVAKYSQFMSFPIYLKTEKVESKTVEVEDEEGKGDTRKKADEQEDDVDVKEETDDGDKKKTKTVETKIKKWELVNAQKAIWLRPKEDVTDKEYKEFYKAVTKDWSDPLTYIHFTGEGEIEFKSVLFIPSRAPMDMFDNYFNKQTSIKLFVRRVLVADQFDDLLPKYLHFVKGVVDSDDLPLNVSREQLQQHKIMKVISKKLAKKVLDLMKKLSKDGDAQKEELSKKIKEETDEEAKKKLETELKDTSTDFDKLWKEFSRNLKLGCYEDNHNRVKIAKILRFYTTRHQDHPVSLERYLAEMGPEQSSIFYSSGDSIESLLKLPQMQVFKKKKVDVVLLTEAMDEPCIQKLVEFEGKKFESIQKGDISLPQTEEEKGRERKLRKLYEPLMKWWKDHLSSKVQKVEISRRLVDDPVAVVSSQWGYSAYMERIMKTQTFADSAQVKMMAGQKILEINPNHPVVKHLLKLVKNDGKDERAKTTADFLFHAALLASGFDLEAPQDVSALMYKLVASDAGLSTDLQVEEVDVSEVEDDKDANAAAEKEESDEDDDEGVEAKEFEEGPKDGDEELEGDEAKDMDQEADETEREGPKDGDTQAGGSHVEKDEL